MSQDVAKQLRILLVQLDKVEEVAEEELEPGVGQKASSHIEEWKKVLHSVEAEQE